MLIDWFTTVAQIVNFLILMWLMKRFLYGPIIRAMDERARAIASRLREAETKNEEAAREAAAYRESRRELDNSRAVLLGQAVQEAAARREELIGEAREEAGRLRDRWREAIEQEKDSLLRDLRHRVAEQVCGATRRALAEMGDAELERLIVGAFIRRLRALEDPARRELRQAITGAGGATGAGAGTGATGSGEPPVIITSAFDIQGEERSALLVLLQEQFGDGIRVTWTTDPALLCGIELVARGHKIAWSFEQFVQDLERDIGGLLEEGVWTKEGVREEGAREEGARRVGARDEAGVGWR